MKRYLILIFLWAIAKAQQIPSQYTVLTGTVQSVNGSSAFAGCERRVDFFGALSCLDPSSSLPFDGDIPILSGLNGNMWASQLLTIQSASASPFTPQTSSTSIIIDFNGTPNYDGLMSIEFILFNCPQWGISVSSIRLEAGPVNVVSFVPSEASCGSFVRLCQPFDVRSVQRQLRLIFTTPNPLDWVHIAELAFYSSNHNCIPDSLPSTASETTTTASELTTTASELTTTALDLTTTPSTEVFFASGMDQTSGQEPDAITIDHTTDDTTTTQTTDAVAITTDTIDHTDDVICTFRSSISSITPPIVISVIAVVTAIVEFIAIVLLLLGRRSPKDKHEVASSLGEEEEAGYEEVDDHMYMEIDAGEKNMLDFQSDEAISSPSSLQQNRVYFKVQEDAVQRGRETTV